jgi:hypothetical protein
MPLSQLRLGQGGGSQTLPQLAPCPKVDLLLAHRRWGGRVPDPPLPCPQDKMALGYCGKGNFKFSDRAQI